MRNLMLLIILVCISCIGHSQKSLNLTSTSTSDKVIGYVDIPNIIGESQERDYENQIEIYGLTFGSESSGSSTGRTRARAKVSPIVIAKRLESSSPYLFQASLQGKVFKEIVIDLTSEVAGRQEPIYTITLKNVFISGVVSAYPDQDGHMMEEISLTYELINLLYREYNDDGSVADEHEIEYDVAAGA